MRETIEEEAVFRRTTEAVRSYVEQPWSWIEWCNPALVATVTSPVAMTLTGAGHAPFLFYLPVLILWGPLFLVSQVMHFGRTDYWSETAIMSLYLASPGLLYLIYTAVVGLSPVAWRWRVFIVVAFAHLAGAMVSAFALPLQ